MIKVKIIPVLDDNYSYLIFNPKNGCCMCIDPAVSQPIVDEISNSGLNLKYIANTHHHHDHVAGNLELKQKYQCKILGNEFDKDRIPGIDTFLKPESLYSFSEFNFYVFDFPGHTLGHIGFYFKEENMLFCGDTLFCLGCGRLFEGTAREMSNTLLKIKLLPDNTNIFFGHEYTQSNESFVRHLIPKCKDLDKLKKANQKRISKNEPTSPTLLQKEKRFNPFLKFNEKTYCAKIGLEFKSAEENFFKLRKMKDNF